MVKVNEYFQLLEDRLLKPIEEMGIKASCTTTLLIIFAAIDSLSKITCDNKSYDSYQKKQGVSGRFKGFLKLMGGQYQIYAKEIYDLRNNLTHTGMNVRVLMSGSDSTKSRHLTKQDKSLYVNTLQFLEDFRNKKDEIMKDVQAGGPYSNNAQDRLKSINLVRFVDDEQAKPTPAPDDELFS